MARQLYQLTAKQVEKLTTPGYHADGGNLYLQVTPSGSKSWIFRFTWNGKRREMGLGSARDIPLREARDLAAENRQLVARGLDPMAQRPEAAPDEEEAPPAKTFRMWAEEFLALHEEQWSNPAHRKQWRHTLRDYVYPHIGDLPTDAIDVAAVRRCLDPIWSSKTETADRVRGRIARILDYAQVNENSSRANPARWKGNLALVLPNPTAIAPVEHHPALPYADMPRFWTALATMEATGAAALRFLILTAARSQEVLEATWAEVDLAGRRWTVPAARMKARREHRVPLSPGAVAVLEGQLARRINDYVFPSPRYGNHPLSNMALPNTLTRLGYRDITVHGFRSTFRDWVGEETDTDNIVAEAALAHTIGNAAEAAYRRGDLYERRAILMAAWCRYVTGAE